MTASAIPLGNDLTIARAAEVRELLLARLAEAPAVLSLDLGSVADFDSAGIQLLLATRRSLAEAGGRLVVTEVSGAVRAGLQLFGLDSLLQPAVQDADEPEAGR